MRLIYLIRHATPAIHPEQHSRDWPLSERGIAEAGVLAGVAEGWGLEAVYSSAEPKSRGTALIIGDALGLPVHVVDGFGELRLPEWISNADDFNELVRDVLEGAPLARQPHLEPQTETRAPESAFAAAERFADALRIIDSDAFPAAIISHGRILTAYLSHFAGVEEAFAFWRSIPMPGWATLDLDGPHLLTGFA